MPGAPRPVRRRVAGRRPLGPDSRATRHGPSPSAARHARSSDRSAEPAPATVEARSLQASALRRIWSTLLDRRDWASYVYVPLLVPILVLLPYLVVKSYQRSQRINQLVESLSQGSRDLEQMSQPARRADSSPGSASPPRKSASFDEPDLTGFEILQDSRILDLRSWKPAKSGESDAGSLVFGYRRLKVFKQPENAGNNLFRVHLLATSPQTAVRFPPQQLQAKAAHEPRGGASSRREGVSLGGEL